MDRVTKSGPITPKMSRSYGSINSIIFSKGFLTRPPTPPQPCACNFYINFKPLSCIKLFCGRELCVWEERAPGGPVQALRNRSLVSCRHAVLTAGKPSVLRRLNGRESLGPAR